MELEISMFKLTNYARLVGGNTFIAPAVKDGVHGIAVYSDVNPKALKVACDTGDYSNVVDWSHPTKFEPDDETGWVY